jgi:hypothetical protein
VRTTGLGRVPKDAQTRATNAVRCIRYAPCLDLLEHAQNVRRGHLRNRPITQLRKYKPLKLTAFTLERARLDRVLNQVEPLASYYLERIPECSLVRLTLRARINPISNQPSSLIPLLACTTQCDVGVRAERQ